MKEGAIKEGHTGSLEILPSSIGGFDVTDVTKKSALKIIDRHYSREITKYETLQCGSNF